MTARDNSTLLSRFKALQEQLPLIAILRGIQTSEVDGVGAALAAHGFGVWEVPLNSPDPLTSIRRMRERFPDALVGAGTVLTVEQVHEVHAAGGQLIISPNCHVDVIAETARLGMISLPGIFTPTEAFAALAAGAHGLKLFPAELASPAVVKALLAVLPRGTGVYPVGGVSPEGMRVWVEAGAAGFGIGSALFKPGKSAEEVGSVARQFVEAYRSLPRLDR